MDTTHVREFLVFCESMNYSVAARALFCSRSALRQHVASLEAELQVPLVEAAPAGHKLTVFGQAFMPEAARLVAQEDAICTHLAQMRENLLVVSVSSSSLVWLRGILFRARTNVMEAHPEKQVQINTVAGTMTSTKSLLDGTCDIAVFRVHPGCSPYDGYGLPQGGRAFKLATEPIRYFAGVANPICSLPRVTLPDLAGRRLLVTPDIYESYLRAQPNPLAAPFGMQVATRDFTDYQEYYAGSFEDAIGSVPERFVERYGFYERADLRVLDIEGLDLLSDFYVGCTPGLLANPCGRMLFDAMEGLAAQGSGEAQPMSRESPSRTTGAR